MLTDKQAQSARCPEGKKVHFVLDRKNLYLRVRPPVIERDRATGKVTGRKPPKRTWTLRVRTEKNTSWIDLGQYPDVSLADARERADEYRKQLRARVDPIEKRKADAREKAEAEEQARREAELLANRMTGESLIGQWVERDLCARKDRGAETLRAFMKDVMPLIGAKYADEIVKADILAVMDRIAERGAERLENRTLSDLRQLFRWALMRDLVKTDPTFGLKKRTRDTERDRVLDEDEIRQLAKAMRTARLPKRLESSIWVMLATGCRVGELCSARWNDVDFEARVWILPETKNGKPHRVFLSDFVISEFQNLKKESKGSAFVMPGRQAVTGLDEEGNVLPSTIPMDPKTIARAIKDRQQEGECLSKRSSQKDSLKLKGGAWTPHDLRRTAATLMADMGIRPDVIERCLNHVEPNRIKRTYQRSEHADLQAQAWGELGRKLSKLRG
jgi:integrase